MGGRVWGAVGLCWTVAACGSGDDPIAQEGSGDTQAATTREPPGSTGPVAETTSSSGSTPSATTETTASADEESTGEPLLGAPYPILLAHGFFGFENLAGLDFVPYWHGVPEHLAKHGELNICIGTVDPFNDSTDRGEQLLDEAIACAARTGHAKVNIIGHSQGGLDARVVASLAPELVASVTTIATPHHGTPIADIAVGAIVDPGAGAIIDWLVQLVGAPLWDEVGNETSLYESMLQMSTDGMIAFNEMYPDEDGVLYTSLTGRTGLHDGGTECEPDSPPPPLFITMWDDTLDTTDPLFLIPEAILSAGVFSQEPNDALVRVVDARWGEFLGCVPADHVDEVGHLLGDNPGLGNDWDHLEMYAGLVDYLRFRDL